MTKLKAVLIMTATLAAEPRSLGAQQTDKPKAPAADTGVSLSGVLYANFQYRSDPGLSNATNKFDLERAYLTARAPAGERASIRLTADVFQQANPDNDGFYRGWTLRAKYAYLQYDVLRGASWRAHVRAGLLQTVVIEQMEYLWPRWLGITPVERAGYFSSADAGIAATVFLPANRGELYTTITNGPGYTSRETDRFKDYAARLTFFPFRSHSTTTLRGLSLSAWHYQGRVGSKFTTGGPGQIGPIGAGLTRTRTGIFAGVQTPLISAGLDYSRRRDQGERNANTFDSPRLLTDSSGALAATFAAVRIPINRKTGTVSPVRLVGRWDHFTPNRDVPSVSYHYIVGGVLLDLNKRVSLSLDYQEQVAQGRPFVPTNKLYFMHMVANF